MDSRRATVRNMRSKCRCSCVLQFTFRRAVSCVLHRPPSQVIHCIVLYLIVCLFGRAQSEKLQHVLTAPHGRHGFVTLEGARILKAVVSYWLLPEHRTPHESRQAEICKASTAKQPTPAWKPRTGKLRARGGRPQGADHPEVCFRI